MNCSQLWPFLNLPPGNPALDFSVGHNKASFYFLLHMYVSTILLPWKYALKGQELREDSGASSWGKGGRSREVGCCSGPLPALSFCHLRRDLFTLCCNCQFNGPWLVLFGQVPSYFLTGATAGTWKALRKISVELMKECIRENSGF